MKKIMIEQLMPENKDFYIVLNDKKQGFMMYQRTPIAHVGYQGDKLIGKTGWYYKVTEFDVIKPHDNIEDIFGEIFQLVEDDYTFSNFQSAFLLCFSPREVQDGYDRVTCIDGEAEWERMPATVWVGTSIYEQRNRDVEFAQRELATEVKRMLKDDVAALKSLVNELANVSNDIAVTTFYKDYEGINNRIAKSIAQIRSSIMDIRC